MAKIKPERAAAKEEITSFAGIGGHASSKGRTAGDCCNFRICGDGSLEKRSGWSVKREFNNPIRAVWQGSTSGESLSFAVSGGTVFRLRGTYCDNVGTLSTTEGEVSFLHYGDAVYLQDGKDLWVWRSGTGKMEKVIPYVPLFGQNWHPSSYGDVKEPINLLTRSLRVHYLNTTAATGFSLPFFAESVDVVRVDGRSVTDFYLTAGGDTVQIPSAASGSVVEVAFTMAYSTDWTQITPKNKTSNIHINGGVTLSDIGYHMRQDDMIPHIDLKFEKCVESMIKEIVIGPKCNVRENDIKTYLASNGIECPVIKSNGTYR